MKNNNNCNIRKKTIVSLVICSAFYLSYQENGLASSLDVLKPSYANLYTKNVIPPVKHAFILPNVSTSKTFNNDNSINIYDDGDAMGSVENKRIDGFVHVYSKNGNSLLNITNSIIDTNYYPALSVYAAKGLAELNANALQVKGRTSITGKSTRVLLDYSTFIPSADIGLTITQSDSNGEAYTLINNSTIKTKLQISANGNDYLFIGNSHLQAISNTTQGLGKDSLTKIHHSQIDFDGSKTSGINTLSRYGTAELFLDDVTVHDMNGSNVDQGVQLFGETGAYAVIKNSAINDGVFIHANTGKSTLILDNTRLDNKSGYYLAMARVGNSYSDVVDKDSQVSIAINNSTLRGNIVAENYLNGSSQIDLTGNTTVTGYLRLIGQNMIVNMDHAQLNGDIYVNGHKGRSGLIDNTQTTVNFSNMVYRGNIFAMKTSSITDNLALNINNGAMIGGESKEQAMQIKGFKQVHVNINYVDPSLINTNKGSYFDIDTNEKFIIKNLAGDLVNGSAKLKPVRSGIYVLDDVIYHENDVEDKTGSSVWDVTFTTEHSPSDNDLATDLKSGQAGLLASEDMHHQVITSLTRQFDTNANAYTAKVEEPGSHLWSKAIGMTNERRAGSIVYRNHITGGQFGGDIITPLSNHSQFTLGAAYTRLHNNLNLTQSVGGNNINGDYYSLYAKWAHYPVFNDNISIFMDGLFSYGNQKYDDYGKNYDLTAGASYRGYSWLWQSRIGANMMFEQYWLQPYATVGYSRMHTDEYNDGYVTITDGAIKSGFAGLGLKMGSSAVLTSGITLLPSIDINYLHSLDRHIEYSIEDYHFNGQAINAANIGTGLEVSINKHWMINSHLGTEVGSHVNHSINGYLGVQYHFSS